MEDDRQTHTLPADPAALDLLARKMPPAATGEALDADSLARSLDEHLAAVREIYERVIHAQKPLYYTAQRRTGARRGAGARRRWRPT